MKPQPAVFQINDRWRLSEDGEMQWILQTLQGTRWRDRAWCGTRTGLLEVFALPHHKIAPPAGVLVALSRLPEYYEPGALDALALARAA